MRIRVIDLRLTHQRAARLQQLDDRRIGVKNPQAVILRQAVEDPPGIVNVRRLVQAIAAAGIEIVRTMRRRSVNSASSLLGRDVVGIHAKNFAIKKRMLKHDPLQPHALEPRNLDSRLKLASLASRRGQGIGDDINLAILA